MRVVEISYVLIGSDDGAHGRDVEAEEHTAYCGDDGQEVGVIGFGELHLWAGSDPFLPIQQEKR